ncbi:MAG: hypothetical protein ACYCOZ_00690 [Metallibacterium scheffleri]
MTSIQPGYPRAVRAPSLLISLTFGIEMKHALFGNAGAKHHDHDPRTSR